MHFIARLELELGSNKHLRKRVNLEILKLDSARLDYNPTFKVADYLSKDERVVNDSLKGDRRILTILMRWSTTPLKSKGIDC
jgi:hypothetical protein